MRAATGMSLGNAMEISEISPTQKESWGQKLERRLPEQRAEQDITVQWAQGFCLDGENILGMDGGGGWRTTMCVY